MSEGFCPACRRHVYIETVLKGPNKGKTRTVSINGKVHSCGTDRAEAKEWTEEEKQFIRKNYGPMTAGQIAKALNRPPVALRSKIAALQRRGIL